MTRHVIRSHRGSDPVQVVAGYDRPLRALYLQVWDDPDAHSRVDQVVLYASHLDRRRDWSRLDSVAEVLDTLLIPVPSSFLDALDEDQALDRGNRVTHHAPVPLTAFGA